MRTECDMLGALLSERRRGELAAEEARALDAHLAGCGRCRDEARALESVLALVELPPVAPAELEALRARRIAETVRPVRAARAGWQIPAVLVAAAAAAVLTVSMRPASHHAASVPSVVRTGAAPGLLVPGGDSQELFPELGTDVTDESPDNVEDDAALLEGPGLFGNLDG